MKIISITFLNQVRNIKRIVKVFFVPNKSYYSIQYMFVVFLFVVIIKLINDYP